MARRTLRPLCLLALLAVSARAQHECDRLAAHPQDAGRVMPPTDFAVLDADRAIQACQAALATDPSNGRWMLQLGRAYNKKQDYTNSLAWTRKAVEAGYPFALHAMSLHYHYGEGVPKDLDAQVHWLQKARAANEKIEHQKAEKAAAKAKADKDAKQKLAKVASSTVRTEDVFARYGGEEFGVICRGVPLSSAGIRVSRCSRSVRSCSRQRKTSPLSSKYW